MVVVRYAYKVVSHIWAGGLWQNETHFQYSMTVQRLTVLRPTAP